MIKFKHKKYNKTNFDTINVKTAKEVCDIIINKKTQELIKKCPRTFNYINNAINESIRLYFTSCIIYNNILDYNITLDLSCINFDFMKKSRFDVISDILEVYRNKGYKIIHNDKDKITMYFN